VGTFVVQVIVAPVDVMLPALIPLMAGSGGGLPPPLAVTIPAQPARKRTEISNSTDKDRYSTWFFLLIAHTSVGMFFPQRSETPCGRLSFAQLA